MRCVELPHPSPSWPSLRASVFPAAVMAALIAFSAPASANENRLTVPLSEDFDYAPVCNKRSARVVSRDWSQWDGKTIQGTYDDMLLDAQALIQGTGGVARNKILARRMLEVLRVQPYEFAGRASSLLGRLLVDPTAGPTDLSRAISLQDEAISKGFLEGANFLGRLYSDGQLVPKDALKAEQYFRDAADSGDPDAALSLARLYSVGPDAAVSSDKIKMRFDQAVSRLAADLGKGECDVLNLFAGIYSDDDFGLLNPQLAAKWLTAAAKTGDFVAIERLSARYLTGEGVDVNRDKAIELLEGAAKRGRSSSRLLLVKLLLENPEIPQARLRAKQWLILEADRGNERAYELLASLARGDYGGTRDDREMVVNLQKAAQSQVPNPDILRQLGSAYAQGWGTSRDMTKAIELLTKASELGSDAAAYDLYQLLSTTQHRQLASETPVAVLRRAANNGFSEAMAALSSAYSCGVGVDRNATIGARWLARAAAAGNRPSLVAIAEQGLAARDEGGREAFFRNMRRAAALGDRTGMVYLSDAYRMGIGTDPDPILASRWYNYALAEGADRAQALLLLSRLNLSGANGRRVDVLAAEKLLADALSSGDPSIGYELGKIYAKGADGIPANIARAAELFSDAAERGHVGAMLKLADLKVSVSQGHGRDWRGWLDKAAATGDSQAILTKAQLAVSAAERLGLLKQALTQPLCSAKQQVAVAAAIASEPALLSQQKELLERALEAPISDASTLFRLANILIAQHKGTVDHAAAAMMLKAAEAGKVEAMREIGRFYANGLGVGADRDKAITWLVKAVQLSDNDAIDILVEVARATKTSSRDAADVLKAALDPLTLASDAGSAAAAKGISTLYGALDQSQASNRKAARKWLLTAAEHGDGESMLRLSDAFASGAEGYVQSDVDSTYWLVRAARSGYQPAFERYAIALQLGYGVKADPQQAALWLKKVDSVTQ